MCNAPGKNGSSYKYQFRQQQQQTDIRAQCGWDFDQSRKLNGRPAMPLFLMKNGPLGTDEIRILS